MKNKMIQGKPLWRWWAKALGQKASHKDCEADKIAIIRTIIFATYLITNAFIVAGVIRQWNRSPTVLILEREVPSHLSETQKEEGVLYKTNRSFEYD
jgi:hypothetical protein